jgi:threonylcarbamoyladenosine tRNA methylthiotransferase MtaB
MRVHLTNLGCKLNQAELERFARELNAAGHRVVGSLEEADLHVINTCTVTHVAARDSRKLARRGRRVNPAVRTVVTGCWASEKPEEAAALAGVDLVVPNPDKDRLLERIHERFPEEVPGNGNDLAGKGLDGNDLDGGPLPVPYVPLAFGHTRALVKVEDGCNMRCAFCIIPNTRGRQHSRPLPEVVAEVGALVAGGAREVVVTGVQISHYRWRGRGLYDLVAAILGETAVPRLRVTSIAPWKFDRRLLALFADRRLCRHVHLSLQSGSTATLARMRRPYTAEQYAALVEEIRAAVPGIAVTTDVIVGFPGETAEEFAESLAFVERMAFAKPHVFPYSVREGTEAERLPGHVPHEEKRARMGRMLALAAELERRFARESLGETLEVLWEERRGATWTGTTDNYLRVTLEANGAAGAPAELANTLTPVEITGLAEGGGVRGRLLPGVPGPLHGVIDDGVIDDGVVDG